MRKNLKWKKLIGLVMSCLMICSIVPLNSFALQNDYRYDEFLKYDAENSQIVLLNGSDENNYKKLTIPAYIGNDKVEKITSIIFNDLPVEEIEFMDGIKEISAYAISHCNTLKKVKIPSTCEIIGGSSYMPAIEYCKNLEIIEMCGEYISLPLFVADCPNLKDVIFYGDVRNITTEFKYNFYNCQPRDKTVNPRVFTEKINVTLQCKSNSNIEKFAIENDFKFVSINDMYVPSTWAIAEVESAINRGYVPNDIQKDYNEPIKRGEFARMAVEFLRCELGFSYEEFSEKVKSVFDMVDFSDSADEHVILAAQCGIVYGYEDNIFAPDKLISREEAAAMLARVYNLYGNIYSYSNIDFQDNEQISDWAVSDVKFCISKGIMKGVSDSHFDPKGEYTREQAIVTFWRLDSDTDWENHNKTAKIRRKMTK